MAEDTPVIDALSLEGDEGEEAPDVETPASTETEGEDTEDEGPDSEVEYLQKFDEEFKQDHLLDFHPETRIHNFDEISALSTVSRNEDGAIVDELHRTVPFVTKYERARILGIRAKQVNAGADAFVSVPDDIIDGYSIATLEYNQRKIPFIIRRPLPNGGSEYWKFADLEQISY